MRNEERKQATNTAKSLLRWITGRDQLNEREEADLKTRWQARLILTKGDNIEELWAGIKTLRNKVSA